MTKGRTLTRANLVESVHQDIGLPRQDCTFLIERTLDLVSSALKAGDIVKLSGFGVFQVREKRARVGRNPKTGTAAVIAPRRVISFRASQAVKAKIDSSILAHSGKRPGLEKPASGKLSSGPKRPLKK